MKPFFQANNYNDLYDSYNTDYPYGGEPSGNGALWVPFRAPNETGIPFHVLFDKDGYCRATFYGGHGGATHDFYLPYFKNLLGLP